MSWYGNKDKDWAIRIKTSLREGCSTTTMWEINKKRGEYNFMKKFTLYIHTNKINNKVYVGVTSMKCNKRWDCGRGYLKQPRMGGAVKKYGWDNFEHIILFENLTEEEAYAKEISLIRFYNSNHRDYGYNVDKGGVGSNKYSEETIAKMRVNNTGEKNPNYGNKMTDEHKAILRATYVKPSAEVMREKCWRLKEKAIIQFSIDGCFIERFNSAKEASESTGVSASAILKCTSGSNKTSGGFLFLKEEDGFCANSSLTIDFLTERYNDSLYKIVERYDANNDSLLEYHFGMSDARKFLANEANIKEHSCGILIHKSIRQDKIVHGYKWKFASIN